MVMHGSLVFGMRASASELVRVGMAFFKSLSVHEITHTDAGYHVNAKGQVLDEAYALYACYGGLNGWNRHTHFLYLYALALYVACQIFGLI